MNNVGCEGCEEELVCSVYNNVIWITREWLSTFDWVKTNSWLSFDFVNFKCHVKFVFWSNKLTCCNMTILQSWFQILWRLFWIWFYKHAFIEPWLPQTYNTIVCMDDVNLSYRDSIYRRTDLSNNALCYSHETNHYIK